MPLAICTLSFILQACFGVIQESCDIPDSYFYLTDAEKKLWPLTEKDSFVMVSNKGERIVYSNGKKFLHYDAEFFSRSPECSWQHLYEYIRFLYYSPNQNSKASLISIDKLGNHVNIKPIHSDSIRFYIPFSHFTQANYKYYIQTNNGLINCLAYGDSIYYSQTEGIIRYVPNDSIYWTREF